MAARWISGTAQCDHVSSVMRALHWLPVSYLAQFKGAVLSYKALSDLGPKYLNECFPQYQPSRAPQLAGLLPSCHCLMRRLYRWWLPICGMLFFEKEKSHVHTHKMSVDFHPAPPRQNNIFGKSNAMWIKNLIHSVYFILKGKCVCVSFTPDPKTRL